MRPVSDVDRFPRLVTDDGLVMGGVHRQSLIVAATVTDGGSSSMQASSQIVAAFPAAHFEQHMKWMSALHPTDAQRANLVRYLAVHPTLSMDAVYRAMVRIATQFGHALERTGENSCPLEDQFLVPNRSYVDTANAVASVVFCRELDLTTAYRISPETDVMLRRCMALARPDGRATFALTPEEITRLNAVYVAFLLQPAWFDAAWGSQSTRPKSFLLYPHVAWGASPTGAPGANVRGRKNLTGGGNGYGDDDDDDGKKEERPSKSHRTNSDRDVAQSLPPIAPVSPVFRLYEALETFMLRFVSDTDAMSYMRARNYRQVTNVRRNLYEIKQTVDLIDFQQHPLRRGKLLSVFVNFDRLEGPPRTITIPNSVERCRLDHSFPTFPLAFGSFSRVRVITMGYEFNMKRLVLPASTEEVFMGNAFNQPDFGLSDSVRVLHTGQTWTHPLPIGPHSQLRELDMSRSSSFIADALNLPATITSVVFPRHFNGAIAWVGQRTEPLDLMSFAQNSMYNQPNFVVPPGTMRLRMGEEFNQPDFEVSTGVVDFAMSTKFAFPLRFAYPCVLTHLMLGSTYNLPGLVVPRTVTHFTMGSRFNEVVTFEAGSQLRELYMGYNFNQPIHLPRSVRVVEESYSFNNTITFDGDVALDRFVMGPGFNRPGFHIPGTVTKFVMGDRYNQADFVIPMGTENFEMGYHFDQDGLRIPPTLLYFFMGNDFDRPLTIEPGSVLQVFRTGDRFNRPLMDLPHTLFSFQYGRDFSKPYLIAQPNALPPFVSIEDLNRRRYSHVW